MSAEEALALLRRWRDAALNDDASALGDLTDDTTDVLDNLERVNMGGSEAVDCVLHDHTGPCIPADVAS